MVAYGGQAEADRLRAVITELEKEEDNLIEMIGRAEDLLSELKAQDCSHEALACVACGGIF